MLKAYRSQLPALCSTDPHKCNYSTKYFNNERSYFKHGILMAISVGITWGIYNYIRGVYDLNFSNDGLHVTNSRPYRLKHNKPCNILSYN